MKNLKKLRAKDEDADRFLQSNKSFAESPTSMKMKQTFILQNTNSSFDNYALMMKKRKTMGATSPANKGDHHHTSSRNSNNKMKEDDFMGGGDAEY